MSICSRDRLACMDSESEALINAQHIPHGLPQHSWRRKAHAVHNDGLLCTLRTLHAAGTLPRENLQGSGAYLVASSGCVPVFLMNSPQNSSDFPNPYTCGAVQPCCMVWQKAHVHKHTWTVSTTEAMRQVTVSVSITSAVSMKVIPASIVA